MRPPYLSCNYFERNTACVRYPYVPTGDQVSHYQESWMAWPLLHLLDYSDCPTCPDSHELEADSRSGRAWRCAGVAILRATANIFMRPCLQVARLATIVLDVARVKPYKTRRLKFVAQKHPELLGKLRDTGLILA
jgi:hypothetical protein